MATTNELLAIARKEIGVSENPPNSNNVKYNTFYYGREVSGSAYPWCAVWIFYVFNKAGVQLPIRTASCGELMRSAQKQGMWVTTNFQPGDVVIYDFSGKQKTTEHCGVVEMVLPDYGVQAIEGNTSQSGSQSNGGMVCRKARPNKYIIGAVRPVYDTEIKQEDVSKMTIKEFIDKLTNEQAYALLQKAQKHAATLAEPEWSQNEGQWAKAIKKKIVNGGSPEGLIKRDEIVAIIGRIGLLE